MSTRKVVVIRRSDFPSALADSTFWQSRAQELVSSGLIDLAAQITALSDHLTDSVMATLDADSSERAIFIADFKALRSAVWEGIGRGIIERLDNQANQDFAGSGVKLGMVD